MYINYDLNNPTKRPKNLFRLNSINGQLYCPQRPKRCYQYEIATLLKAQPHIKNITLYIHGTGYSPHKSRHNPHNTIYARYLTKKPYVTHSSIFNYSVQNNEELLYIAYAWDAHSSHLSPQAYALKNYENATAEIRNLYRLVKYLSDKHPHINLRILCNDIGVHTVLCVLPYLKSHKIDKIIMLNAVAFISQVFIALASSSTDSIKFYNIYNTTITKRLKNLQNYLPKEKENDELIVFGFPFAAKNWHNYPIDTNEPCLIHDRIKEYLC